VTREDKIKRALIAALDAEAQRRRASAESRILAACTLIQQRMLECQGEAILRFQARRYMG
jgi:hypothetical protein